MDARGSAKIPNDPLPWPSQEIAEDFECGPIEPNEDVEAVRKEPYPLPGTFEWQALDLKEQEVLDEVYTLLANNYVEDDDNMFRFEYSREFLKWALLVPDFQQDWHLGVRVKGSGKLVAFISGIPVKMCAFHKVVLGRSIEVGFGIFLPSS